MPGARGASASPGLRGSLVVACVLLAACRQGLSGPPETPTEMPLVAADETLRFGGTEPFWGGEVTADRLRWTTPDNIEGVSIAVERFEGLGGVAWSGSLEGALFDLMATMDTCSDGMSDRTYPITVTVKSGGRLLTGCGHTRRLPFTGPAAP